MLLNSRTRGWEGLENAEGASQLVLDSAPRARAVGKPLQWRLGLTVVGIKGGQAGCLVVAATGSCRGPAPEAAGLGSAAGP